MTQIEAYRGQHYQKRWRANNRELCREWDRQNKAERRSAISTLKLERGCVDCGYNMHPEALTFDHVRGKKLFTIAPNVTSFGIDRILDEIEKCEVRCFNCHMVVESIRRSEEEDDASF